MSKRKRKLEIEPVSKWVRRSHIFGRRVGAGVGKPKDQFTGEVEIASENGSIYKPAGFWWQWRRDWERWCAGEMPHWLTSDVMVVEIDLSKILRIRTHHEFLMFEAEYLIENERYSQHFSTGHPDWDRIRAKYSGIEIAPYRYDFRYRSIWYNGWDCASGVVWGKDAVRFVEFKERKPMKLEAQIDEERSGFHSLIERIENSIVTESIT